MKISVITVVLNNEQHIETAIQSVKMQNYNDIEYIVVDGGSSDGTLKVIDRNRDYINFLISEPDRGIYDAINKGISVSTGDVIALLHSDDFFLKDTVISDIANQFDNNPDVDIVLGGVDFVRSRDLNFPVRLYSSCSFSPWKMRFGFMPPHPGAFVRKSAYDIVGYYRTSYKIGGDFDWFVRAFFVHRIVYKKNNSVMVRMRIGGVSTAGVVNTFLITREILKSLKENKVYSNLLFVLVRLPIKYLLNILRRGGL